MTGIKKEKSEPVSKPRLCMCSHTSGATTEWKYRPDLNVEFPWRLVQVIEEKNGRGTLLWECKEVQVVQDVDAGRVEI